MVSRSMKTDGSKKELRRAGRMMRKNLSEERRLKGRAQAFETLKKELKSGLVLSFASLPDEINLDLLNHYLAKQERLLLPRMVSSTEMAPYLVRDLKTDLLSHSKLKFLEPNPLRCTPVSPKEIQVVLVPGIAFDREKGRIGFGKGHYDRLLSHLSCPFYGVGFKEQLLDTPFPKAGHDVSLTKLYLF